jgi:hypothetical protein
MFSHRSFTGYFLTVLIVALVISGCGDKEIGKVKIEPSQSLMLSPTIQQSVEPAFQSTIQPTDLPTIEVTPTPFVPGLLIDPNLDIMDPPVDIPLLLQIPALKVNAPMMAVGLTPKFVMDAPKGNIGDPVWHTAFWFRGGGIPGDVGTATIAGHVNDPLGDFEIFGRLRDLNPGDLIIIHDTSTDHDVTFKVDEVKVYSVFQSAKPEVLAKIYGAGPVAGTGPQPSEDGLSHLTLITCSGYIKDGEFDRHVVVYATRSD